MSLPQPPSNSPFKVSTLTLEVPLESPIHSTEYTDSSSGSPILSSDTILLTLYYPCAPGSPASSPRAQDSQAWLEPPKLRSITGLLKYAGVPKFLAPAIVLPAWGVVGQKLPCLAGQQLAAEGQGKRTTILLSHGLGGTRTTYSTLCIGLAAFGHVVAAIEHRDGSSSCTTIHHPREASDSSASGGLWSWICGSGGGKSTAKLYVKPDEVAEKPEPLTFRRAQIKHRMAEVDAALEILRRIDGGQGAEVLASSTREGEGSAASHSDREAISSFAGKLDLDHIWIAGHSFGGATALEVVRRPECPYTAALLMDPWFEAVDVEGPSAKAVTKPVYTINSEHFTCWKSHMADVVRVMKAAKRETGRAWLSTLSAEPSSDNSERSLIDENGAGASASPAADRQEKDEGDINRLVVVHDMFGTLFSLEEPTKTLLSLFPEQLDPERGANVPKITAELIVMDWFHATQRDFTYSSVAGAYMPIASVFKATLPRVLLQSGLLPRGGSKEGVESLSEAGSGLGRTGQQMYDNPFGQEVVDTMMAAMRRLTPRPGMERAFLSLYRDREDKGTIHPSIAKVDVWAATNGSLDLARSSFLRALGDEEGGDIDRPSSSYKGHQRDRGTGVGIFSCDEVSLAKPAPGVYTAILERVGKRAGEPGLWFVASHTWDLFAAKRAGFKTAWVTYEEHYPVEEVYGRPDIIAASMDECAAKILEWEHEERTKRGDVAPHLWRYTDEDATRERPLGSQHTAFSDFPFLLPSNATFSGSVSANENMDLLVAVSRRLLEGGAKADEWNATVISEPVAAFGKVEQGAQRKSWRVWKEGSPVPPQLARRDADQTASSLSTSGKKSARLVVHSLDD